MKSINLFIFGLILFFLNINYLFAESNICDYEEEINECKIANENQTTKNIDKFICINGSVEKRIFQIILDLEFKKIDNKMDNYLENLENNKNIYFGKEKKKTFLEGINDIDNKSIDFYKEYENICGTINFKVKKCFSDQLVSIENAKDFFSNNGTLCKKLINKKIKIFEDISFNILMLNKGQIKADEKKIYDQNQRKNYNRLLDIMMINLGYLERIWQKIPTILANPYK